MDPERLEPHNVMFPPQLWADAKAIADSRYEKMSEVLRRKLVEYVKEHRPPGTWYSRSSMHPMYTVTRHPGGVVVTNTEAQLSTPVIPLNEINEWMGATHSVLLEYVEHIKNAPEGES